MANKLSIWRFVIGALIACLVTLLLNYITNNPFSPLDNLPALTVFVFWRFKEARMYMAFKNKVRNGLKTMTDKGLWSINNLIVAQNPITQQLIEVRNDNLWEQRKKTCKKKSSLFY